MGDGARLKQACIILQALRRADAPGNMPQAAAIALTNDQRVMLPILPGAQLEHRLILIAAGESEHLGVEVSRRREIIDIQLAMAQMCDRHSLFLLKRLGDPFQRPAPAR